MKEVIPCGTKVETVISKIPGIITGISIRYDYVTYEVSYFTNNEYKSCWLQAAEFNASANEKVKVGFVK